ncbi:hypothetical protein P1P68_15710 [Streptomyces scabiei]|uniref:hypothetical protein n=1 Tax=Streptomyces scabiei TaxID=1930 RepID=UPI00298FB85E|nr:hypothetical protein [Streptomyces scabiei]MDW8806192.1 hypothetical protein [Streptomyces scabiei]
MPAEIGLTRWLSGVKSALERIVSVAANKAMGGCLGWSTPDRNLLIATDGLGDLTPASTCRTPFPMAQREVPPEGLTNAATNRVGLIMRGGFFLDAASMDLTEFNPEHSRTQEPQLLAYDIGIRPTGPRTAVIIAEELPISPPKGRGPFAADSPSLQT